MEEIKSITEIKREYNKVSNKHQKQANRIEELKETKEVQEYLKLTKNNDSLYYKLEKLYRDIKVHEYSKCKHLIVYSHYDSEEGYGGRTIRYQGCIKCGCYEYAEQKPLNGFYHLSEDEKAMVEYLESIPTGKLYGTYLNISCENFDDAIETYKNLKENNKGLSENSLIEMIKAYIEEENKKAPQRTKNSHYVNIWDVP